MRTILFAAVTAVLLAAESSLALDAGIHADLATLIVVYVALQHEFLSGLAHAVIVGYLADISSGESRGLTTSALVIVFLVLRLFVFRIVGSRWLFVTAIGVASSALALGLRLAIENLLGPGVSTVAGVFGAVPSVLVSAALLAYPCYRVLHAIDERFGTREEFLFRSSARR